MDTLRLATFFTPGTTDSSATTVHVHTSTDGREFDLPQGVQSIGGSNTSMNDPSVMYRDGYFWIVSGVKVAGQPALQIFYSADLRTWNSLPVTLLDASWDGGVDSVAPEWFQDADGSLFVTLSIGNYFSSQDSRSASRRTCARS